ncbi:hypothetical protein [Mycolicibacterium neoaurum]|uniref:hypothetical protein n=1 Tax=Mycolicibacterium neoaurum TaxID=1795 RepID=UPI001F4D002C|nr:hypothetical protein [Mycolicibacterium neoaurum]
MSGPPPAEVIQAFLTRADRVISSELVDAARLKLSEGFSFTVHLMKDGGTQVTWLQENEYLMKGLAADLRPFLPWVDDATNLPRVINAVLRSLPDPEWKRNILWFKDEYQKLAKDEMMVSYWSMPSDGWQMRMPDRELAKTVLNSQWFHESLDPRIRHILNSENQSMGTYQAVSRLLNNTIMCVAQLKKLIVDADDAGQLHPATK